MLQLIKQLLQILFGTRKVLDLPKQVEEPEEVHMTHHDYVEPKITINDKELYKEFLSDHNNFNEFHYRKGAAFTAPFGIANGWGENFTPGYVRIHHGVDRARGGEITTRGKVIKDIVISPMNFDSSDIIIYGDKGYGTLVFLSSKKYSFDMRIAHMNPNKSFIPWSLDQFKKKKPFQQGWYIGSAGSYGYSTGAHTHTELVSHDAATEVFELMLLERWGDDIYKQYTDEEIVSFYQSQAKRYPQTSPYAGWTQGRILQDWTNLKANKKIFFINKYKSSFIWNGNPYTKYATNMFLKGL